MTAAPGSMVWLLAHELRLARRGFFGIWSRGKNGRGVWIRLGVVAVMLHLAAVPIALALAMFPVPETAIALVMTTGGLLVIWNLMLSQSLFGVTQALYMRGDLDLLLSSPLSARNVLVARALAIVVNAIGAWTLLALPFVDILLLFGQFRWISIFPVLVSLGLTATAFGLALAMALFALIGPAKTRAAAQVLAVLIGATAFLSSQARALLPDATREALWAWLASLADADHLGLANPLWWPARALLGEPVPLMGFLVASLVIFGLAILAFGRAFASNATAIAGVANRRDALRGPDWRPMPRFGRGQQTALLRKEWRLLLRDPWLISQVLMQILYLLPLCFLYWRQTQGDRASLGGLAMMAAVVAGHLAGGLIWITISSEDAPELLAAAPVEAGAVLRAKLIAALGPVAALLLVPLLAITSQSAMAGAWALAGCTAAAVSATLLGLWYQKPEKRRNFMRRRKGSAVVNLAELVLNFSWGLATAMAISGSIWAFAFVALALTVIFGLRFVATPMAMPAEA
jgi:ABC-2 type transport system permease protein